jgi:hypothetical protein
MWQQLFQKTKLKNGLAKNEFRDLDNIKFSKNHFIKNVTFQIHSTCELSIHFLLIKFQILMKDF